MKRFNFVKYQGDYLRGDSKISIQLSGLIRLSSGFCRASNALSYKCVFLYYDSGSNAMGLEFSNSLEKGALKVTQDRNAGSISAKSFFKNYSLNLKNIVGRYGWEKNLIRSMSELYVIEL